MLAAEGCRLSPALAQSVKMALKEQLAKRTPKHSVKEIRIGGEVHLSLWVVLDPQLSPETEAAAAEGAYQAAVELRRSFPDVDFDFHVVNLLDYDQEAIESNIPSERLSLNPLSRRTH